MTGTAPLRLLLAGSELGRVWQDEAGLQLRLSAALVMQAATANHRAVDGWSLGVQLSLPGAELLRRQEPLIGRIAQADLRRDGQTLYTLPLPGVVEGPLRLSLALAVGAELELIAPGIVTQFTNGNNFHDTLAC